MKVVLGVSSSISLYKACEIIRGFQKKGASVHVLMTKNAARMISPLLFSALSGNRVRIDPLGEQETETIAHIDLARETSLLVVAPATANIIGKFAAGIADDFLSTFYMVVKCPVLVAPAMNEGMYLHAQTQNNVRKLKSQGVTFIEPGRGRLACGDEGWGRLAEPEAVVEEGWALIRGSRSLEGRTVLVTAGPTREPLDPVRYLSNRSSGKMGFALAEEAVKRGAEVILVSGPVAMTPPADVEFVSVETAAEMKAAVETHFERAGIIVMAAAVSDFSFADKSSRKIKKGEEAPEFELVRTDDILVGLGERKKDRYIVGFAAETDNVRANAREKLIRKKLDLIVANDVSAKDAGFESDFNRITLIFSDGTEIEHERATKRDLSRVLWDAIEEHLDG